MNNSQAHNAFVLSLKTNHQMDDSAIKNLSESYIVMPRIQEELYRDLSVKSGIIGCFLSDKSLVLINMSDATEILQRTRNKLEILEITDSQVYNKILYRINKQFNYWFQECIIYPTNLDVIDWGVIDFRDIISNIKYMDFQTGPLPPRFNKFNAIDTKTPKGPSNNEHNEQPSRKKAIKSKLSKEKNESTLSE